MKIKIGFLFALSLVSSNVRASDLFLQLDSPTLTGGPGDTLTFSGTIVNNDDFAIDLNGIDISLNGMFTTDNTLFFFGPASIDAPPGTETVDFELFSVTVNDPYTDPLGIQTGTATILGNVETNGMPDLNAQNPLGSATFNVDVTTPEPSSFAMMMLASLAGAAAAATLISRRRRAN
jgi:PEP-CTERM motif